VKLGFGTRSHGEWQILAVSGDIDMATAPALQEELSGLVGDGHRAIAVDLGAVDFMDSTGLRVLVATVRALPDGGRFGIVGARPNVRKVLDLTAMHEIMIISSSESELPA
jgi:anti-sigma B factor antagonist